MKTKSPPGRKVARKVAKPNPPVFKYGYPVYDFFVWNSSANRVATEAEIKLRVKIVVKREGLIELRCAQGFELVRR